jgi:maltose-binding protein MalE
MKYILKKGLSIGLSILLLTSITGCTNQNKDPYMAVSMKDTTVPEELVLWYTNEGLSTYIEEAANEYKTEHNITIVPKLVSEIDYIENMNQAVLSDETAPDLFISENCDLEKLYLAGLTTPNQDADYTADKFYETALNAFTYKDKLLAYPLYFETSYLIYNANYVTTPPSTMDDILNFASEFDAPEGVETILNWDVTDALCNYFFIGNYINHDENAQDSCFTDKDKVLQALTYYQSLNQYFAIDADTVDYEEAFQNFMEGKSVFTIAKTDKLPEFEVAEGISQSTGVDVQGKKLSASVIGAGVETIWSKTEVEGNITDNTNATVDNTKQNSSIMEESKNSATIQDSNLAIKIAPLPNLTNEIVSKGIAVSYGVFVNGYTSKKQEAADFAKYLSYSKADQLYQETGKLSVYKQINYNNENISTVLNEYAKASTAPKLMEEGDFWLQLEIAFSNIWKGADVTQTVEELGKKG